LRLSKARAVASFDKGMKPKLSKFRNFFRFLCWGSLAVFIFTFVVVPTFNLLEQKWVIDHAIRHAQSIKLIHYNPYAHFGRPEIIYGTKELDPKDFDKVLEAFPLAIDVGFPVDPTGCLFDPHHRIVITDASGQQTVIRVCFLCDHYQVGALGGVSVTPYVWRATLNHFFTEEGLPYQPDRYMKDYLKSSSTAP
jgi:hypothetical protein